MLDSWCAAWQVEYPAGQVAPHALMSALTRAGLGADTLSSVADKLLAAPYLQGGVSRDALSSSSLLRDRDMHGGAVKPAVILAAKKALGVRAAAERLARAAVASSCLWSRLCLGRRHTLPGLGTIPLHVLGAAW